MTRQKGGGIPPDPEVPERARRRRFSAEYKLRILQEVDRCGPGGIGALLRREGLYSSHLGKWRQQRESGALMALSRKRGRKPEQTPEQQEIARLRAEVARLEKRLAQTEKIVEVQKKLAAMEQALDEQDR
jgi:transposase-like protein